MENTNGKYPYVHNKLIKEWENSSRTDGKKGTFEWWYFDFYLENKMKIFVVFYTKHVYKLEGCLEPFISLKIYNPERKTYKRKYYSEDNDFYFSKDKCEIRIGPNYVISNDKLYKMHLEIDQIELDIILKRDIQSWRPHSGHFNIQDKYFAWLCSVPAGQVKARLKLGEKWGSYSGYGYHDHNWGNVTINEIINSWYWIHCNFDGYSVVAACITKKDQTIDTFLMLSNDDQIVFENYDSTCFVEKSFEQEKATGDFLGREMVFECVNQYEKLKMTIKRSDTLKAKLSDKKNQIYIRCSGEASLVYEDKNGIERLQSTNIIIEKVKHHSNN